MRRYVLALALALALALGPAAGGVRFWHYADHERAITDALRLSRGMSFKNAMADLPMGGGKGVVLAANPGDTITQAQLEAFGRAVESLGGRYVTAEDVGMSEASMKTIATMTKHVSGLPVAAGSAGGDPGELGTCSTDVGDHEHGQCGTAQPHAVPLTYQADKPLPGDYTHACCQTVEEHEGNGGQQQNP